MDVDIFRRFLAVIECGSLNKAAQAVNVSQPALSKSIHQLEEHYGVLLLHRGAQGISPTEYGVFLAQRFRLMQNELTHVKEEMRTLSSQASRRLSVGAPPGLGYVSRMLVNATASLTDDNSQLSIDVRIGSRSDLLPLLRNGEIDLLFAELFESGDEGDLHEEPLFVDHHVLTVRAGHPLASKKNVSLCDMLVYPWAIGRDSEVISDRLTQAARAMGLKREDKSTIRSESSLYISSVVANSDFIGIVTTDTLELGVLTAQFRRFWVDEASQAPSQQRRQIGVIYRSQESLTFAARAMLREVRNSLEEPSR